MIDIKIKNILEITSGNLINGNVEDVCNKIIIDSREVDKNSLFMPVLGEVQDGHIFLESAMKSGFEYGFCELKYFEDNKKSLKEYNLILVENTTEALQLISSYILKICDVKTVGVTGSLGKTSTKEMISSVLSKKYKVHKNKGNFNNHIGLPLTIFEMEKDDEIAVLEMGMNHFKEIEVLVGITKPDIGVITNIGTSHIGILGSQENIFKAKMEMVTYFDDKNTLILNGDDKFLKMVNSHKYKTLHVGLNSNNDIIAYDLKKESNGCYSYKVDYLDNTYTIKLNVLGRHNVVNSLLAISVALELKVDFDDIIDGIYEFTDNKKRLELISIYNDNTIINDCYNASSESMISAIDVLNESVCNRKIAVLGDILELGTFSKESHEKVGEYISDKNIDCLITYGKESEYIKNAAILNGFIKENIYSFMDQNKLIEFLIKYIDRKDIILIKGSFGMNMNNIIEEIKKVK